MAFRKYIDIGSNLTDPMYQGIYHGSHQRHQPDLLAVLKRAFDSGLDRLIVTGGSVAESSKAIELSHLDDRLFATVGCHPTRCREFETDPDEYLDNLAKLVKSNLTKVVAFGECGLDYDRIQFCSKDLQIKYFHKQLVLNNQLKLPLFLHCRNAASDLYDILKNYQFTGVVHSFDGTITDANKFIDLGYYIGINGCSLKTPSNLDTVKQLPIDRVLIETDSPWCDIRPTHAGYQYLKSIEKSTKKWQPDCLLKGRNEPINIRQVLEIIAAIKQTSADEMAATIYSNTEKLFKFY